MQTAEVNDILGTCKSDLDIIFVVDG